jgi:hypothetical protein
MKTSSALQPWNDQHLLGHRGEVPYNLAGISVGTQSDRAKAPYGELAKPRLSRCDRGCVSRIKFAARIAHVIWRDLNVHLLPHSGPDMARLRRVSGPFLARLCKSNARRQLAFRGTYQNWCFEPASGHRAGRG